MFATLPGVSGCQGFHGPVVAGCGVVVDTRLGAGVDVDGGVIQARNAMDQLVLGLVGDGVGFNDAQCVVHRELGLGAHPVSDPTKPDAVDTADSRHLAQRCPAEATRWGATAATRRREMARAGATRAGTYASWRREPRTGGDQGGDAQDTGAPDAAGK